MTGKVSLHDRAKSDLQSARLIISQEASDELLLDVAPYHVQQGVEKLLKFSLATKGERPKHTHDIAILAEQLESAGDEIPAWLNENIDTLNSYATKTRYGSNIVGTKTKITQLLGLAEEFLTALQPTIINDDAVKPSNLVN